MNVPNLSFWWRLLATLGLEISCLAGLGFLAQRLFRSAAAQRAVWQVTVLCVLLVTASDFTGFGRGAAQMFFGQKQVLVNVLPSPLPPNAAALTRSLPVKMNLQLPVPRPPVFWPGWLWLAGTVLVFGRMAAAQALLLTLRLRREKIVSRALQERVGQIASRVGLRQKANLLWMPRAMSPMAFGLLCPTLGLPPDFETAYSAAEQDAVLAHELAHLAAGDPRWFLLADFATAILWWHPLVWWVRRLLHLTAELAADEETALVPDGPDALAKCLVTLGKKMTAPRGWGWIGINGGFQSRLGMRVERLLRLSQRPEQRRTARSGVRSKVIATLVVSPAVVLLFGAMQIARGQKQETWQKEMSASWHSSPGARLLLASLDDKLAHEEKREVNIATQVQKAKLLYEMGKFNEAQAILTQVSNSAPSNQLARYYLDLIRATPSRLQVQPIPLDSEVNIATQVQKAKLLYEMRKLDRAEAILVQVLREDPSNRTALYYLDLIKEARYSERARARIAPTNDLGVANPWSDTNLVYTTKGRQAILSKLDRMRLNEVRYNAVPLTEVLNQLRRESTNRDPDGEGINFMVNPYKETSGIRGIAPTDITEATAAGAGGFGGRQTVDMSQITITISPPMSNLRFADVLDAITKVSDQPIRYTVEDYAVVFSPKPDDQIPLYSKVFRVDPKTFIQGLQGVFAISLNPPISTGSIGGQGGGGATGGQGSSNLVTRPLDTVALHQLVRQYFTACGVILTDPGKTVFFNDRTGLLYVRATEQDLEIIQKAIETLNQTPPQMTIEAKFTELSLNEIRSVGLDDYQAKPSNNSQLYEYAVRLDSLKNRLAQAKNELGTNHPSYDTYKRLVDNAQRDYDTNVQRFTDSVGLGVETNSASNSASVPPEQGTVALGNTGDMFDVAVGGVLQNAQLAAIISAIEQHTYGDILSATKVTTLSGRQVHVSSGSTELDLTASVEKDGFAILANGFARVKTEAQSWFQNFGSSELLDGQTLVFSAPANAMEPGKRVPVVFVTLRIIDAAGNAVHTDEEISKHAEASNQ